MSLRLNTSSHVLPALQRDAEAPDGRDFRQVVFGDATIVSRLFLRVEGGDGSSLSFLAPTVELAHSLADHDDAREQTRYLAARPATMTLLNRLEPMAVVRASACLVLVLVVGSDVLGGVSDSSAVGALVVESEPAGASVYLDGRLVGETPVTLPAIAAGVHRVRVMRLGYLENSRLITVKPGAQATLRARLTDPAPQTSQTAALKIVVLQGEGAVNIIQQKTAVAPVVEVRDRNDQPVSGALVKFAIHKGKASFDGARTLTVTTNAAGRATAAGLTPTGSGALQIATSAAFQGQTAAMTIAQTTVMTAAQAASASSAAAASGGAAGGAGGGLSTTTLAVLGGAVAGGAVVGAKVLGGRNDVTHYSGTFSGLVVTTYSSACIVPVMHTGTLNLDINVAADGTVTGTGEVKQTRTITQGNCGPNVQAGVSQSDGCCDPSPQVRGTTANLTFNGSHPGNQGTNWTYEFAGALSGAQITGTFTLTVTSPTAPTSPASFPVSLR